jgi:hypothetical protein
MFVSEARLVSRLKQANIVQIFDFDRYEDTFLHHDGLRPRKVLGPSAPARAREVSKGSVFDQSRRDAEGISRPALT